MIEDSLWYDDIQQRWYGILQGSRIYLRRGMTRENAQEWLQATKYWQQKNHTESYGIQEDIPSIDEIFCFGHTTESFHMPHIYLWGAGKMLKQVYASIDPTACVINGIIDSYPEQKKPFCDYSIQSPKILQTVSFDAVIITAKSGESIKDTYIKLGLPLEKLIHFWKDDIEDVPYLNRESVKIWKLEQQKHLWEIRSKNAPFEYAPKPDVVMKSSKELLQKILNERCSLTRFGDGEFSIILQEERSWFQKSNKALGKRLLDVLHLHRPELLIAIADNYGSLEKYTDQAADGIRDYQVMQHHRERILPLLEKDRTYYNAYVSRPYYMYRDKSHGKKIFDLWQRIFKNRDILLVEGLYSRFGVGNHLLDGASSVRRILGPDRDAFQKHEQLLACIQKHAHKGDLVLISLGAAATVMVADVAAMGVQAIDIGQLDNEYDWYQMGVDTRVPIPGKMTAEALPLGNYRQDELTAGAEEIVARCF